VRNSYWNRVIDRGGIWLDGDFKRGRSVKPSKGPSWYLEGETEGPALTKGEGEALLGGMREREVPLGRAKRNAYHVGGGAKAGSGRHIFRGSKGKKGLEASIEIWGHS